MVTTVNLFDRNIAWRWATHGVLFYQIIVRQRGRLDIADMSCLDELEFDIRSKS